MFYERVSDFFEAEGDFEENLEIDPCCLLYKEPYGQDHEYDCVRAIAHRREQRQ